MVDNSIFFFFLCDLNSTKIGSSHMFMCSDLHFGSLSKLQISIRMFLLCCRQPAVLQGNEETLFGNQLSLKCILFLL